MTDEETGKIPATDDGKMPESPTQEAVPAQTFDREYVEKLREENKARRIQLEEFEAAKQKAEDEKLAQDNEWQVLAEKREAAIGELTPYKEKYEAVLASMGERNKALIESFPEAMQSLVPDYGDDHAKLSAWLDANAETLGATPLVPSLNGGAGNSTTRGTQKTLSSAQLAMAERMGLTSEAYAKSIK